MTAGRTVIRWVVLGLALAFGLWYGHSQFVAARDKAKAEKATAVKAATDYATTHPPAAGAQPAPPTKVRAMTPATLTADYGFSLEADAPIMVQYPGEKPFLFEPRKTGDCQQLPQPRDTGPKKFWDPNDPTNGHISFRIYRGRGMCE